MNQTMEIEKEIQISRFVDEYHKATVNLIFTSNWLTGLLEVRARQEQITLHQFNALRIMRGMHPNPCTVSVIRERMIEQKSDVSRIIDRLVSKGLVHRCKSHQDGRAVALTLTEEGQQVLRNLDVPMLLKDILPVHLSEDECAQLNYLLDKMRG